MSARVTPPEAKEVWDSLDKPSSRKVADKFTAAGRSITFKTVAEWKRKGWPGVTAEQIEAGAAKAIEKINVALPVLTGDVHAKLEDVAPVIQEAAQATSPVPAQTVTVPAPVEPDLRSNVERCEDALLKAITGATSVWESIRDLATTRAGDNTGPAVMLMAAPEGIAKLMTASSEAINMAIEGFRQIPSLRVENAAALPGTQTVYAPGEGPHAAADYPLRSAMEAFDSALKTIRERKPA